ncbi:MAG: hypothetical protein KC416_07865, partial [Myxococcales bacterium]|nr:hypothetical protein [Myxococcales bacterium]
PLLPGTTYAAIVKTTLKPKDGGDYERSPTLDKLLMDKTPSGDELKAAWTAYSPLRDWLDTNGETTEKDILNAAVFTTQSQSKVAALRTAIRARNPAALKDLTVCDGQTKSPCDDGTDGRKCPDDVDAAFTEIHGKIALPIFQTGEAPYRTPDDGGGIEFKDGKPEVARTEDVCFALSIPKGGEMPEDGWPLVVYGHGTGGSFRSPMASGIAKDAATGKVGSTDVRVAVLGIDLPQHGSRKNGSTTDSGELFYNFANPQAARDNILQGAADLMTVIYWATGFDQTAGTSPTQKAIRFDGTRLVLYGHSQGSTHGALILPYETDLAGAILSGNGGNLTQSMLHKSNPVDIAGVLPFALLDPDSKGRLTAGEYHPMLALFQMYFDEVDPVNYARYLHRAPIGAVPLHHVFMTYGLGDTYSPEETMSAYAGAGKLELVKPELAPPTYSSKSNYPEASAPLSANEAGKTIGFRQYEPDDPETDGHFVSTQSTDGRADVTRFFLQMANGDTPAIGK